MIGSIFIIMAICFTQLSLQIANHFFMFQMRIALNEKDLSLFIEVISDFSWVEISQDIVEEFERNMKGLEIKEFEKIFSRQRIATVGITI